MRAVWRGDAGLRRGAGAARLCASRQRASVSGGPGQHAAGAAQWRGPGLHARGRLRDLGVDNGERAAGECEQHCCAWAPAAGRRRSSHRLAASATACALCFSPRRVGVSLRRLAR